MVNTLRKLYEQVHFVQSLALDLIFVGSALLEEVPLLVADLLSQELEDLYSAGTAALKRMTSKTEEDL